jgi:hypothetical protein
MSLANGTLHIGGVSVSAWFLSRPGFSRSCRTSPRLIGTRPNIDGLDRLLRPLVPSFGLLVPSRMNSTTARPISRHALRNNSMLHA